MAHDAPRHPNADAPCEERRAAAQLAGTALDRRGFLQATAAGLSLPHLLALRANAATSGSPASQRAGSSFGRAKRCIVLFAWGGLSHLDTFDMKPDASSDVRGEFQPIRTSARGIHISEHLPKLARRMHHMTLVRSVQHRAPSHRSGAYWNLTGHEPPNLTGNWTRSRKDWPSLGSMVADGLAARRDRRGEQPLNAAMPHTVAIPYPIYDGGFANGQHGGFLGLKADPVIVQPKGGTPYPGKSPSVGPVDLRFHKGAGPARFANRRGLLNALENGGTTGEIGAAANLNATRQYHEQAMDMLLDANTRRAFNIDNEPLATRQAYGEHICGRSVLMARKLAEAGVPLVTVYCAAGDLNGSVGAHFDTHANNFNRLKNQMLPPLDRASAALLDDLDGRGMLDDTLVVWLTEFGRTPKINRGAGRDHFPTCYSVAFAGAGVKGGNVYGKSNAIGFEPAEDGCGPADLHATIFHALGIDPQHKVFDLTGRELLMCEGSALPLFG